MKPSPDPFHAAFRGRFSSVLQWDQLKELWNRVRERAGDGWYVYAVGLPVPQAPRPATEVERFVDAVDSLLRREHREDYCGIVYVDNRDEPNLIKIFDPHNLGVSCGFSKNPPLPGWILSRIPPVTLEDRRPLPANRSRWWSELWE